MKTLALILGGGQGERLGALSAGRGIPTVPFGGKYRLVDFPLSNTANSNLERIAVLVQYRADLLIDYLGDGAPWRLPGQALEIETWQAGIERTGFKHYTGSADALYQNRCFIRQSGCDTLLVLVSDQVYSMDYRSMLDFHQRSGANLTVATLQLPIEAAYRFGTLGVDVQQRLLWFEEQPEHPLTGLVSLGFYIFQTSVLLDALEEDAANPHSAHNLGRNIIPKLVSQGHAFTYPFQGSWSVIPTLDDYYQANMMLLDQAAGNLPPQLSGIRTRAAGLPEARLGTAARMVNSIIAPGCAVDGAVVHSVLMPGVRIERGAVVEDAVILTGMVVRAGAVVKQCILTDQAAIEIAK